jgi:hypothetical protein
MVLFNPEEATMVRAERRFKREPRQATLPRGMVRKFIMAYSDECTTAWDQNPYAGFIYGSSFRPNKTTELLAARLLYIPSLQEAYDVKPGGL